MEDKTSLNMMIIPVREVISLTEIVINGVRRISQNQSTISQMHHVIGNRLIVQKGG